MVLFHGCAATIFTVLFPLSGHASERLGCTEISFKTAENLNYFASFLCSPIPVCTVKLGGFLVKLALSVCTTGAERLLQHNFMLSRTSDMFLLKNQTIKISVFSSSSPSVLSAPFWLSWWCSAALVRLLDTVFWQGQQSFQPPASISPVSATATWVESSPVSKCLGLSLFFLK